MPLVSFNASRFGSYIRFTINFSLLCSSTFAARESGFTVNDSLVDASQPSALATSELFAWVKAALLHCLTKKGEIEQQECMLALIQLTVEAAISNRRELQIDKCRTIHPSTGRFLSELESLTIPGIEGLPDELSCKLAPRIVIAAFMKQKPDSRLNQLSKCMFDS